MKTLGNIATTLDLKKLAEDLKNAKNATEWLKNNAISILNFIGKKTPLGEKFGNYSKLITGSVPIVDNTLAILKGNLSAADRAQKFGLISSSVMTFGTGILNGVDKYKFSMKKYIDDGIPEKIAKHDALNLLKKL